VIIASVEVAAGHEIMAARTPVLAAMVFQPVAAVRAVIPPGVGGRFVRGGVPMAWVLR